MPEVNSFAKVLSKTEKKIGQLQKECAKVRLLYESHNPGGMYEAALRTEELSEETTLLTRSLPVYTGARLSQIEVEHRIAQAIPVEIGFTEEGWFSLRMPLLLPKKAEGSASYIRSFLYPAMKAFFYRVQPIRYPESVLIYRHVYDRDRRERQYRDHDNIELNMVTDIVALYVLPDDAPASCRHYYCSAAADTERTEVYVVPQNEFSLWLTMEKSMPDKGVMLHENAKSKV